MVRHAKELKHKAAAHEVTRVDARWFNVTSATSGDVHRVYLRGDGTLECNCAWAKKRHHDDNAIACSHGIAVHAYIEAEREQARTISAWASLEQARQQHHTLINLNDGITLTTRAV